MSIPADPRGGLRARESSFAMLRNGGGQGTRTELAWRRAEKPFGVLRGGQIGGKPAGFLWGPPDQRLAPQHFAPSRWQVAPP